MQSKTDERYAKNKKKFGFAGFRSPYLPHAKRTCYQVHHEPLSYFGRSEHISTSTKLDLLPLCVAWLSTQLTTRVHFCCLSLRHQKRATLKFDNTKNLENKNSMYLQLTHGKTQRKTETQK
jgi:hypothetical protein